MACLAARGDATKETPANLKKQSARSIAAIPVKTAFRSLLPAPSTMSKYLNLPKGDNSHHPQGDNQVYGVVRSV